VKDPTKYGVLFFGDERRSWFGAGLSGEFRAIGFRFAPQFDEILDDVIVHDREPIRGVRVALSSAGQPCVAQQLWPIPSVRSNGSLVSRCSRL
jgi:hypothetical protein